MRLALTLREVLLSLHGAAQWEGANSLEGAIEGRDPAQARPSAAVFCVAQYGHPGMGTVDPDLVGTAGVKAEEDQIDRAPPLHHPVGGEGVAAV